MDKLIKAIRKARRLLEEIIPLLLSLATLISLVKYLFWVLR